MIIFDPITDIGFDFDEDYSAKKIRTILRNAFNRVVRNYGYNYCEDSTSVLTVKFVDSFFSRIKHSCDFAIAYEENNGQQYIRFNKQQNNYTWEYRSKEFKNFESKSNWLKSHNYWNEVKIVYLKMKNNNTNPYKQSRSLYAETINNLYNKYR